MANASRAPWLRIFVFVATLVGILFMLYHVIENP
jgi:hypothetical protein